MAEPSGCNAENNGLTLFQMMGDSRIAKVTSADHCDFESPTDVLCEANCLNPNVTFGDPEIRSAILTLGTAAIVSLADVSPDGALVWTPEGLGEWTNTGLIQEL